MTEVATAPTARTSLPIGTLIDKMWAAREKQRQLEAEIETIKKDLTGLEEDLIERMDAEGTTKSAGRHATVSFTFSTSANVVDGEEGWAKLYAYIKKTGYWSLLHRRITDTTYRELLEAGKKVPGLEPFTKRRVNLRAIPTKI